MPNVANTNSLLSGRFWAISSASLGQTRGQSWTRNFEVHSAAYSLVLQSDRQPILPFLLHQPSPTATKEFCSWESLAKMAWRSTCVASGAFPFVQWDCDFLVPFFWAWQDHMSSGLYLDSRCKAIYLPCVCVASISVSFLWVLQMQRAWLKVVASLCKYMPSNLHCAAIQKYFWSVSLCWIRFILSFS